MERNQGAGAAAVDRCGITALVRHEMLERSQKKGTQAALLLSHGLEIFALENQGKKTLSEILRLLWPNTLPPHEAINGSPVSAAKTFQRLLGRRRFTLCLQHHAPVRSGKCDRAASTEPSQ